MPTFDALWTLERRFWLEGAATYAAHMAPDACLVFPWPTGVLDRDATLSALQDAPRWRDVAFDARRQVTLGEDGALLTYTARARQDEDPDSYEALCTSAYRRTGDAWQLVLHQQTPSDMADVRIDAVAIASTPSIP